MSSRFLRVGLTVGSLMLLGGVAASCGTTAADGQDPAAGAADNTDIGVEQAGLSKCGGGANGDGDFCSNACLCGQSEGDCDSDAQCSAGLVCNAAKGVQFCFGSNVDVCAPAFCRDHIMDGNETQVDCGGSCGNCCPPPVCTGSNGDGNFCDTCQCAQGEGDCDSDSQCGAGLVCAAGKGTQFCLSSNVDICAPEHCRDKVRNGDETQPDCGGSCGTCCPADVCASAPANGTSGHCTTTCPCPAKEGGCTTNATCNPGLVCKPNSGALLGMPQTLGVCVPSTCSNTVKDGDETAVDCGGSCFPCSGGSLQSTRYGGSGNDVILGSAYDANGNLFLVGRTSTNGLNLGCGALTFHGGSDVFLAKLNAGGGCVWSKSIGGSSNDGDAGAAVAVDSSGNVVVGSNFYTTVNFGGPTSLTVHGTSDIFVAKYNANGVYQWANQYGGTHGQRVRSIAIDGAGTIFVTGGFQDSITFGSQTFNAVSANDGTLLDIYVAKLSSSGTPVWAKAWGTAADDQGLAITTDASGYVYLGGYFSGAINFGTGVLTSAGGIDAFGLRINPATAATMWAKRWGGTGGDRANGIAWVKSNNNIVFGGAYTTGTILGPTGATTANSGSTDGFVISTDRTTGVTQWSKHFGSTGADSVVGVAARASDSKIAVTGTFVNTATFLTQARMSLGSTDIFLVTYDAAGTGLLDQIYGGAGQDTASSIATTTGVAEVGSFYNAAFTFNASAVTNAGGSDAFNARFSF